MQAKDVKILANLLSKKKKVKRATHAQKRRDITNANTDAIQSAIVAIRDKMREDRFVNDWSPA